MPPSLSFRRSVWNRLQATAHHLSAPAPVRPVVLFQSDDWGRVGLPSLQVLEELRATGVPIGDSPWDYYGLETEEDVIALGDVLADLRDRDGRPACFTANFVMANADLPAMRDNGYRQFRWISIDRGLPRPWGDHLIDAYRHNIRRGVFYPGLHGFTHFNHERLVAALGERSPKGDLARTLANNDIPYLASLTPEFNFALVYRDQSGEHFLDEARQSEWISKGVGLFSETFGFTPRTACAPGYRANDTTLRLWKAAGIDGTQSIGLGMSSRRGEPLQIRRNVRFEPVLNGKGSLEAALEQSKRAAVCGFPIVVCSHSINFVSRHNGRARQSREELRQFIEALLRLFPNLRFASDVDLIEAHSEERSGWFRRPTMKELTQRMCAWAILDPMTVQ